MPKVGAAQACAGWLAVIGLAAAVNVALGQADGAPDIPFNVRNAAAIGDAERKAIEDYVKFWSARMTAETAGSGAVAEAKDKLTSVVEGNPSRAFRDAYSAALGAALPAAASHSKTQVRLSAMIAAAGASSGAVAEVCATGLADPNIGVRYQAAKAVADIFDRRILTEPPPFNDAQQQKLLASLRQAIASENSELVYHQLGRAMSRLTTPAAFDETLKALDLRLQWLRARPQEAPRAPQEMIHQLLARLNERLAMDQNVDEPLRNLTAICGKYLALLVERIEAGAVNRPDAQQPWAELVEVIEREVFKRAVERLAPDTQGPSLVRRIERKEWGPAELGADIGRWIGSGGQPGLLSSSPINIAPARLTLPPLPQGSTGNPPLAPGPAAAR